MRAVLCCIALAALPPRDADACVRPDPGLLPHVLDPAHAGDAVPPLAPSVTYTVSRTEIGGGGCGTAKTDCDGKYGRIYLDIVAFDETTPPERLAYLVTVVGGDVPAELIHPWHDGDPRVQAQGSIEYGFDYDDNKFDFEIEVRVVDLNGNISEPAIVRIADEYDGGGGCASAPGSGALVLVGFALALQRRRCC